MNPKAIVKGTESLSQQSSKSEHADDIPSEQEVMEVFENNQHLLQVNNIPLVQSIPVFVQVEPEVPVEIDDDDEEIEPDNDKCRGYY